MTATEARTKSTQNEKALLKEKSRKDAAALKEAKRMAKILKQKFYDSLSKDLGIRLEMAIRYGKKEVIYNFGEFGTKPYECCKEYFLKNHVHADMIVKIMKEFKQDGYEVDVYGTTHRYTAESSGECGSGPDHDYFVDEMEMKISW